MRSVNRWFTWPNASKPKLSLAFALSAAFACASPSETWIPVESTDTHTKSNILDSSDKTGSDANSSSPDENENEAEESEAGTDSDASSTSESESGSESHSLSEEDTTSMEEEEDSGPKFDLMIPPDMPIGPSNCEEEGLDDPAAGIYCVHHRPHGIFLADSNGDGRTEVVVANTGTFSIFEHTATGLEKTVDSPLHYPKVGKKQLLRPSHAHMVAMPRVQSPIQDWLVSWSESVIGVGDIATAEVMHPRDPLARFVFSDSRSLGDWFPQVLQLEQNFVAAYLDQRGQLTTRTRNAQNQWSPPTYYTGHDGNSYGLETHDLNQDGHQDFVIFAYYDHGDEMTGHKFNQGIAVRFGDGKSDFSTLVHNQLGIPAIISGKIGDVTGDGLIDAILMGEQKLYVAVGLGEGLFDVDHLQTINFSDSSSWSLSAMHAADFNGDQHIDVALSDCEHELLHILLASPGGTLELTSSLPTADCVRSEYAAPLHTLDVNHDGNLDLLALGETTETLRVYFGDGEGTFVVQ